MAHSKARLQSGMKESDLGIHRRAFLAQTTTALFVGTMPALANRAPHYQDPPARMRRVWLRLLANSIESDAKAGKKLSDQQRYFAGLTGVRFLYLDEQNKDVILEGPADDSWSARPDGMVIGEQSGRPLLQLDDFVIAWRNTIGNGPPPSVSLEHRAESIQKIQEVIKNTPQPKNAEGRAAYSRRLQEVWGPQDAVTGGVPTNTRFNKVMVDADWDMKRVSLGLSDPQIKDFPTYVDLEFDDWTRRVAAEGIRAQRPAGGSRFWFYPAYTEFEHSAKLDAVEIPGDPVQLLTESHFRDISMGRQVTQEPSQHAMDFIKGFTKNYGALADKNPLYGELRNLFDWVAVARLIQKLDAPRRIGWDFAYLSRGYPVAELQVPSTMPGQIALRHAEVKTQQGQALLVLPARGGVSIDVQPALRPVHTTRGRAFLQQLHRIAVDRPVGKRFWT
jgi:hypothetical protein